MVIGPKIGTDIDKDWLGIIDETYVWAKKECIKKKLHTYWHIAFLK